jgi:hypothetical protein
VASVSQKNSFSQNTQKTKEGIEKKNLCSSAASASHKREYLTDYKEYHRNKENKRSVSICGICEPKKGLSQITQKTTDIKKIKNLCPSVASVSHKNICVHLCHL